MNKLYPDYDYDKKEDIPFYDLKKRGIKGLIFDIDNTLTKHGAKADVKDIEFFDFLKELGFDTVLLSNNKKERVEDFARVVNSKFIYKAKKPATLSYLNAIKLMNLEKTEVAFVGDQIFTDILGAKRTGVLAILVKPIDKKEEIQIVLKRRLEAIVLYFYNKSKKRLAKNV